MKKVEEKQTVIRSAAGMSMGTLLSRILGLARDVILPIFFNLTVIDAFNVAFKLPNMFRRLLGEGSLSVSFIPVYIDKIQEEKQNSNLNSAKMLASAIHTMLILVSGTISALGIYYMDFIMSLMAGGQGFISIPGKLDLAIWLGKIMFGYLFLVTLYAYYMAIANAWKHFFWPAMAPAFFNLTFILSALIPESWTSFRTGTLLAYGVIFGGAVQVLIVLFLLIKLKIYPKLTIHPLRVVGVKKILLNMVPGLFGLGVLQIMSIVNTYLASELPEGSHTFINWGDRLLELPQSLIAVSLGAALLPTLSQLNSEGKINEMLKTATKHFQLLLFLTLPCCVGLFLISIPLTELLFMRGSISQDNVLSTAMVVKIYSFLLIASSLSRVIVPSFYARKNTWLPATISLVTLIAHVIIARQLTYSYGLNGLVLSTTISGFINAFLLIIFYKKLIGPLGVRSIFKSLVLWLPGLICMTLWIYLLNYLFSFSQNLSMSIKNVIYIILAVLPGSFAYIYISKKLGSDEAKKVLSIFSRKLGFKPKVI